MKGRYCQMFIRSFYHRYNLKVIYAVQIRIFANTHLFATRVIPVADDHFNAHRENTRNNNAQLLTSRDPDRSCAIGAIWWQNGKVVPTCIQNVAAISRVHHHLATIHTRVTTFI